MEQIGEGKGMLILLYQVAQEKRKQIQKLCRQMNIRIKDVTPEEYKQVLGVVAGVLPKNTILPNQSSMPDIVRSPLSITSNQEEMLVFCGFQQKDMDTFLKQYRETGVEPISLKAVVTQYNIFWSIGQLQEELKREREVLKKEREE